MQLTVMNPADGHDELVAHSTRERAGLCEGEVMRVRWYATAHKAGLPKHKPAVLLIAQPNRFAERMQHLRAGYFLGPLRTFGAATHIRAGWVRGSKRDVVNRIVCAAGRTSLSIADAGEPGPKTFLDNLRIRRCQTVLRSKISVCPGSCLLRRTYARELLDEAFPKACR